MNRSMLMEDDGHFLEQNDAHRKHPMKHEVLQEYQQPASKTISRNLQANRDKEAENFLAIHERLFCKGDPP